jgi:hypothetical protein
LLGRELLAHEREELLLAQAIGLQHCVELGPVELAVCALKRRHRKHRRPQCGIWHHHVQPPDLLLDRNLAHHLAERLRGNLPPQHGCDLLALRQLPFHQGHVALEALLELSRLDGLATHLRHVGRGSDLTHYVADTPDDEGHHHDPKEDPDRPGFQVVAKGR